MPLSPRCLSEATEYGIFHHSKHFTLVLSTPFSISMCNKRKPLISQHDSVALALPRSYLGSHMAATGFITTVTGSATSFLPLTTPGTSAGAECAAVIYKQANDRNFLAYKSSSSFYILLLYYLLRFIHNRLYFIVSNSGRSENRGPLIGYRSKQRSLDMLATAGNIIVEPG